MSDAPPTNAAVDWQRAAFAYLNTLDELPDDVAASEDFIYEDHRSGGVNFGRLGASEWSEYLGSMWDLDAGRPVRSVRDVVAVREQRSAAVLVHVDYGNEMFSEFILCLRLDRDLRRLQRVSHHDTTDVDGAIASLDRFHAEADD